MIITGKEESVHVCVRGEREKSDAQSMNMKHEARKMNDAEGH